MIFPVRSLFVAALLAAIGSATAAQAHIALVSSTPAADGSVAKPGKIVLVFSEALTARSTGAELTMTGMPGMADHAPMAMTGFTTALGADGKTLTLLMKRALPAGSYDLTWFAAGADSHRAEGIVRFTVK